MNFKATNISDQDQDVFNRQGFLNIKNVLPTQILKKLYFKLLIIFKELEQTKLAITQQKFWQIEPSNEIKTLRLPAIDSILNGDQGFSQIKSLTDNLIEKNFNSEYEFRSVHSFLKPAKVGVQTPWHQDPAYDAKTIKHDNITCWIPLNKVLSDKESCLEFIKGSHLGKKLRPHKSISKNHLSALVANISKKEFSERSTVYCELGDIVLHRSYIIHRATKNMSDNNRIAIVFIYSKIKCESVVEN